jgi:hypothetical protein
MKTVKDSSTNQRKPSSRGYGHRQWVFISWFYAIRNVFYGLLFLAYIQFIHPRLLSIVVFARESGQPFFWLGSLVVFIQVIELIGILLKWPVVSERIQRWPNKSMLAQFGVGVAQLSHMLLSMMVFLHVMPLFGVSGMCFDYDTRFAVCMLTNLAFIAILAKEMLVFFLVLNPKKSDPPIDLDDPLVQIREMFGELILLAFGMITFSMSWNAIMLTMEPVQAGEFWVSLVSSAILFLMLYPPSRLIFIAEEWLVRQTRLNRFISILFLLLTMVAAIMEVPGMF